MIAPASGQWLKLVALGQMSSVAHRRRNGDRAPYSMRDFNIDAMGVAWKESRQISVVPPPRAPPLVGLRTPVRSKCEISTDFLTSCDSICPAHRLGCPVFKAHGYTFSHCESASVQLRSADCIGVVSWDATPTKVGSYRHSAPL